MSWETLHAYPEPTVRFYGERATGVAASMTVASYVCQARIVPPNGLSGSGDCYAAVMHDVRLDLLRSREDRLQCRTNWLLNLPKDAPGAFDQGHNPGFRVESFGIRDPPLFGCRAAFHISSKKPGILRERIHTLGSNPRPTRISSTWIEQSHSTQRPTRYRGDIEYSGRIRPGRVFLRLRIALPHTSIFQSAFCKTSGLPHNG